MLSAGAERIRCLYHVPPAEVRAGGGPATALLEALRSLPEEADDEEQRQRARQAARGDTFEVCACVCACALRVRVCGKGDAAHYELGRPLLDRYQALPEEQKAFTMNTKRVRNMRLQGSPNAALELPLSALVG